jgi:hypothetical protein
MPIRLLLQHDHVFGPDEIQLLVDAFEDALSAAGVVDRSDGAAITMAKRIVELAKAGERDPAKLRDGALQVARR